MSPLPNRLGDLTLITYSLTLQGDVSPQNICLGLDDEVSVTTHSMTAVSDLLAYAPLIKGVLVDFDSACMLGAPRLGKRAFPLWNLEEVRGPIC